MFKTTARKLVYYMTKLLSLCISRIIVSKVYIKYTKTVYGWIQGISFLQERLNLVKPKCNLKEILLSFCKYTTSSKETFARHLILPLKDKYATILNCWTLVRYKQPKAFSHTDCYHGRMLPGRLLLWQNVTLEECYLMNDLYQIWTCLHMSHGMLL